MKPAVGGIPPSEIMKIAIASPSTGCWKPSPARSEIITRSSVPRPSSARSPNAPRFMSE